MHTLLAAVSIIKFVGLCTFTAALPDERGVHVVLPRITDRSGIEAHVALLAYERKGCVVKTACVGSPLEGVVGFNYIPLDGQRIRFKVTGNNAPVTASSLPPLPRLGVCCPRMGTLSKNFRAPYPGAAAIVDIAAGSLTSCGAQIVGVNSPQKRIDTTLTLQNNAKTMVISMVKNGVETTLTLRADTQLIIANVPKPWVAGHRADYHESGTPHYDAYYSMGTGTGADQACNPLGSCSPSVPLCVDASFIRIVSGGGGGNWHIASSECSNSQWP